MNVEIENIETFVNGKMTHREYVITYRRDDLTFVQSVSLTPEQYELLKQEISKQP